MLRNREEKKKYTGWSSTTLSDGDQLSGTDSDDKCDDPDYFRLLPPRQPHYRNTSSYNYMRQFRDMELAEAANAGTSSRNDHRRRCPVRPPKRSSAPAAAAAKRRNQGMQVRKLSTWKEKTSRRRRKAPYSLLRRRTRTRHELTANDLEQKTIFSWLIKLEIVEGGTEVCYMDPANEKVMLSGKITESGIQCGCCGDEITVWDFERHARSNAKRPYQYIVLANNGVSLLACQITAWLITTESEGIGYNNVVPSNSAADDNDDACIFCGDGGHLVCCEQCPTTMHFNCMDLKVK